MANNPSDPSAESASDSKSGTDKKSVRARDDFLAVAAHELRNPLTPILLSVQVMRRAEQSGDNVKVSSELDRLEHLVKRFAARTITLLEVAQISSSKFLLKPAKLNLSELIQRIVNEYTPLVVRSGSELIANITHGLMVHLDELAVSEIVENLLSNAIKYGEHKPIELTLTAANGLAQISVRDNGVGIDNKDKNRIFERFERAVGREARSGFGIGLWLTRNLAESMGGSITVIGQPGVGSLFTVTLPLELGRIDEQ